MAGVSREAGGESKSAINWGWVHISTFDMYSDATNLKLKLSLSN